MLLCFDAGDAMQFDWSQEVVILGGVETTVRIAHCRLAHSRQGFSARIPRDVAGCV